MKTKISVRKVYTIEINALPAKHRLLYEMLKHFLHTAKLEDATVEVRNHE